jgi:RNase P subunit RPR2
MNDINYDDFKEEFQNYVNNKKDINTKKINSIIDKIKCLVCLDTKYLWKERNFFSTFDNQGSYEVTNCHNCEDGEFSYYSHTNFIKENKVKVLEFPHPSFEQILEEIKHMNILEEKIDENIPLWYMFKDEKISREIDDKTAEIDIAKLSMDIFNMIQIHAGNVAGIPSLLKSIEMKLNYLVSKEKGTNEWYEEIKNGDETIYILFNLEKETIKNTGGFSFFSFNFTNTKQRLDIRFTLANPKNKNAQNKIDELIALKVQIDEIN